MCIYIMFRTYVWYHWANTVPRFKYLVQKLRSVALNIGRFEDNRKSSLIMQQSLFIRRHFGKDESSVNLSFKQDFESCYLTIFLKRVLCIYIIFRIFVWYYWANTVLRFKYLVQLLTSVTFNASKFEDNRKMVRN